MALEYRALYRNCPKPFWLTGAYNLYVYATPEDGSCLFHAIAASFSVSYRLGSVNGVVLDRRKQVKQLREDFANQLGSPMNGIAGKTWYEYISRGTLPTIASSEPKYSLSKLQERLRSSKSVEYIYNQLISDILNIDIWILNAKTNDVYQIGDADILYKGRNSIILLYTPGNDSSSDKPVGHFETVGIKTTKGIATYFDPNHDLILQLSLRLATRSRLD